MCIYILVYISIHYIYVCVCELEKCLQFDLRPQIGIPTLLINVMIQQNFTVLPPLMHRKK